jgi:hypothetical protein
MFLKTKSALIAAALVSLFTSSAFAAFPDDFSDIYHDEKIFVPGLDAYMDRMQVVSDTAVAANSTDIVIAHNFTSVWYAVPNLLPLGAAINQNFHACMKPEAIKRTVPNIEQLLPGVKAVCSTFEFGRVGQNTKKLISVRGPGHFRGIYLGRTVPQVGDEMAFFATTVMRNGLGAGDTNDVAGPEGRIGFRTRPAGFIWGVGPAPIEQLFPGGSGGAPVINPILDILMSEDPPTMSE